MRQTQRRLNKIFMKTNLATRNPVSSAFEFRPSQRVGLSSVVLDAFGLRISAFGFWPIVLVMFFAFPIKMSANTNLTSILQQALFEEEANHNLNAAIQSYQSLITQFDQDRKLAATAIFRLGECYRKQGNTNDAAAQYERIVRDFSDQATLLNLCRQNLAALGIAPPSPASSATATAARAEQKRLLEEEIKLAEKQLASQRKLVETGAMSPDGVIPFQRDLLKLRRQLAALDAGQLSADSAADTGANLEAERHALEVRIAELKALPKEKLRIAIQQSSPNPVLNTLMEQLTAAEQRLTSAQQEYGPQHAEVLKDKAVVATVSKQIDAQVDAAMEALMAKRNALAGASQSSRSESGPMAGTSAEDEEVRRIQSLIKDSPDLINSPTAGGGANGGQTLLQEAAAKGQLSVVKILLDNGAAVDGVRQGDLTPLDLAAFNGHKAVVDFLLSKGAKADARTENGITPLHLAANKGYELVAGALLNAGAPVNAPVKSQNVVFGYKFTGGETPLHTAAYSGYPALVQLLLSKGADPNAVDAEGHTALSCSVSRGDGSTTKILLAAHANPNAGRRDLPLAIAARRGDAVLLELLLANGANPNTNGVYVDIDSRNMIPPLYVAVHFKQPEAVKILTRFKADPNVPNNDGKPLLFDAMQDIETFKALLDGGADPNQKAGDGFTPLTYATHQLNRSAVEALLAHHADPNAKMEASYGEGGKGYTPLLIATARFAADLVDVLLAAGADPNLRSDTRAPLLNAMNNENPPARKQMVASLLDHGAKPDSRDTDGKTPLMYAVLRADKDSAALLLAHKADVNAASKDGTTSLHLAAYYNHPDLVELLLANKADPNARNNSGQTPLDLAKSATLQPGQPGFYPGRPLPSPSSFANRLAAIPGQSYTVAVTPGTPTNPEAESSQLSIADILRQHGAADDLPDFSVIRFMRKGMGPWVVLKRDTNSLNRFSLLETLATAARLNLQFPSFTQIRIHRPDPAKPGAQKEIPANPTLTPNTFDCAKDMPLEFGDVVEIPEREHTLSEASNYLFSGAQLDSLLKCLARKVKFIVRDQTVELPLSGSDSNTYLSPALQRPSVQNILRSSSDFSHIHIKRTDPESRKVTELTVNVQSIWNGKSPQSDDLWLRDGDIIEVPEKSE
jgi:ankyrin repeat protein